MHEYKAQIQNIQCGLGHWNQRDQPKKIFLKITASCGVIKLPKLPVLKMFLSGKPMPPNVHLRYH